LGGSFFCAFLLGAASPAHAQINPGDCPPGNPASPVKNLSDALAAARAVDGSCAAAIGNLDLSKVTNLVTEAGCKDDGPCTVKKIIDEMAREEGLPPDLLYATAWTESTWTQWRPNGQP